jgi:two-component system, NarL family, response regulator LiaR
MDGPISVLIVDDHEIVRRGIRAYLETQADFNVVGEAASGEQAIEMALNLVPDVVLMDLILPGMDGVESTRRIKSLSPRTQIVVLTSYHEDEHIFPALKAGATAYILKDIRMERLAEALHKAVKGEVTLHPRVAARVLMNIRGEKEGEPNPYSDLTERELEVLKLLANGLSNSRIAEQLYISENTVKGHISNILSKLHLADRTQAAAFAWREGIVRRCDN